MAISSIQTEDYRYGTRASKLAHMMDDRWSPVNVLRLQITCAILYTTPELKEGTESASRGASALWVLSPVISVTFVREL